MRNLMNPASNTAPRKNRTICVYFCQGQYELIVQSPEKFRQEIDKAIGKHPELFLFEIASGYKMKEIRLSKTTEPENQKDHHIRYQLFNKAFFRHAVYDGLRTGC